MPSSLLDLFSGIVVVNTFEFIEDVRVLFIRFSVTVEKFAQSVGFCNIDSQFISSEPEGNFCEFSINMRK